MNLKEKYRNFCQEEETIPIFAQPWWLDAVCGDAWDVCLVEKGEKVVAAMPYFKQRHYGMTILTRPQMTQTLGPWLRKTEAKLTNSLSEEKKLLTELIAQLPKFAYFHQNWHFSCSNWLPFYWKGFKQTTRYTYRLPYLDDLDAVWSAFRENIRRDIRKARDRFQLSVRTDLGIDDFLQLNWQTFDRQGIKVPYSQEFILGLDKSCVKNNARRIFIAEDKKGLRHAGIYIIWDKQSTYYLMGGSDPELRNSGATSLCMWEAIQFAATKTVSFDFEGSMIEPIERFFRAFGAVQTPYFSISKTPSRLIRMKNCFKNVLS